MQLHSLERYSKITIVLMLLLTVFVQVQAQDYTDKLAQIDQFLSSKYNENTPGCAIGIVKDGKLIYSKGFGMANLDYNIPWGPESVINIMSISKQFTAASIGLLVLENKISLVDDIRKYVPELPDYGHKITIDHLIRHTSGIRDYEDIVILRGESAEYPSNREKSLQLILRQQELNFTPGDQWAYSNSGYLLLSYVVERVSGMPFAEFAKRRIFEPLEIHHSFFSDNPNKIVKNRVTSYHKNEDDTYSRYLLNDNMLGAAGLFSTIEDLYKWDQNFYHHKVGGKPLNDLMLSLNKFNDGSLNDYAFGNIIDRHEGFMEVNHSGGLLGVRCKLSRFPTEQLSIIYLGNGEQDKNQDVYPIASLFLIDKELPTIENSNEPLIPSDSISLSNEKLEHFTGLYDIGKQNLRVQVSLNNTNHLTFEVLDWNRKGILYPFSQSSFHQIGGIGGDIKFINEGKNGFNRISATGSQSDAIKVSTVSKTEISNYAGTYYSKELNYSYHIKTVGEEIIFSCGAVTVIAPIEKETKTVRFNEPWIGLVTIQFIENDDSKIDSFTLNTDKVKNLAFQKK